MVTVPKSWGFVSDPTPVIEANGDDFRAVVLAVDGGGYRVVVTEASGRNYARGRFTLDDAIGFVNRLGWVEQPPEVQAVIDAPTQAERIDMSGFR